MSKKNFKKGKNESSYHSVILDTYLKSDISTIICLIKYNGLALGVYLQSTAPVSHITSS